VSVREHIAMLAGYNAWANARVYAAARALPEDEYRADRGAFFRSVHHTLNHILVVDRLTLRRITGEGEAPDRLDAILYADLEPLWTARIAEDTRLTDLVARRDEVGLAETFTFSPLTGTGRWEQPIAFALVHLFNHQTHHRGQIHSILTGLGRDGPVLDLLAFQREAGLGIRRLD
jgi:uncharacterized damage-inducible protein DinB